MTDLLTLNQAELLELLRQPYLKDYLVDSSTPGGTARGKPKTNFRLRTLLNPDRAAGEVRRWSTRVLKPSEVAEYQAMIQRGKRIKSLEKLT